MAEGGERLSCYHTHIFRINSTKQQEAKPRRRDFFRFEVIVSVRYLSNYDRRVMRRSILFNRSICISCKRIFEYNEGFLQKHLLNPGILSPEYFTPEGNKLIEQRIIAQVQQLFHVQSLPFDDNNGSASSKGEVFPLLLDIIVDVQTDEESEEHAIMEESMQQDVTMTPESNEAIQSLKTFTLPQKCNICMENFHADEGDNDEDVKLSSMPCGHVYHHQCIVKWLQISHMCPLCRYCMPTVTG